MTNRLPLLDVLRLAAIVLVLGRHIPPHTANSNPFLACWFRSGWVGVDLFFVLSGTLVSGLLFREYQKTGRIAVGRFLVRRGLKIYPAFYVFLAATIVGTILRGEVIWKRAIVSEVLFLQNYVKPMNSGRFWSHTWSLAVEEHFYLLLAGLAFALLYFRRTAKNPFDWIPGIFAAVATACMGMRLLNWSVPFDNDTHHFPTHLRIDSLMCGVALSYLLHFQPKFLEWAKANRTALGIAGVVMLAPSAVWQLESNRWIWTFGYSLFALASACLVCWACTATYSNRFVSACAYLGTFSYSIYLWHTMLLRWFLVPHVLPNTDRWTFIAIYVATTIAVGIVMAKLVEWPVLRIRDRWFPSKA